MTGRSAADPFGGSPAVCITPHCAWSATAQTPFNWTLVPLLDVLLPTTTAAPGLDRSERGLCWLLFCALPAEQ